MGTQHSTYFAYGARITDLDPDALQTALKALKETRGFSVGYLHAGDYDADMTFLVTECTEIDLGEYQDVTPQAAPDQYATWDGQIRYACDALGIDPMHQPGWLVVPDLS
jgi:hypothetical protein